MKKYMILNFILLGFLFGCSSNNGEPENFYITTLTSGTWKIDLYTHDAVDINTPGINSTADYLNYDLKFNTNGTLTATKGNQIIKGNWDFKFGDFEKTSTQLRLSFNTTGVFKNLNKTWNYYGNFLDEINLRIGFNDFLTLKNK
jgi:hypothetical protein